MQRDAKGATVLQSGDETGQRGDLTGDGHLALAGGGKGIRQIGLDWCGGVYIFKFFVSV